MHIGTPRNGVPANEFTMDVTELTGAGRSTTDYWVRYSLGSMLFAGVFDKFPGLKIGSVEHEAAWIPHWLKQMDFTYLERPVFTKGWKSAEGLMPSDYWKRNMFVEFMEDDLGVQLRDRIGVENMLWGSDYPHAEATFPRSQQFLAAHVRRRARGRSAQDHLGQRRQDVRLHAELNSVFRARSASSLSRTAGEGGRGVTRGRVRVCAADKTLTRLAALGTLPQCGRGIMSEGFVPVAKAGDVPPGSMTVVAIDRERIMLANVDGQFFALRDMCGHRNAPLSRGRLDGCIVECPLHFAQFDVRTGKLVDGPISADVPVYEVRVEGDTVFVKR